MGVLRVKVNGVWEEIAGTPLPEPALDEIWVGSESPDPANSEADLWLDNTVEPPTLKYKTQNGLWEPLEQDQEPQLDEVWIGAGPPDPTTTTYELWVDNTVVPPITRFKHADGSWVELVESEVSVGVEDPYVTNPNSQAELWHDMSLGQTGKLKARWANAWHPVAEFNESEVEIGVTDPVDQGIPAGTTEIWIDSSTTPPTLKAWVNGAWVTIASTEPRSYEEVYIGMPVPMAPEVELWYDITNSPKGVLKANNQGVWEEIGGADEVSVAAEDPYVTDPLASDELWYDLISQALKVRIGDLWHVISAKPGTVVPQREYGKPPAIGTSDAYAREDHEHGTVPEETYIGPDDPSVGAMGLDPAAPEADFWYDTDATPSNATTSSAVNARFAALEARLVAMEARLAQGGN